MQGAPRWNAQILLSQSRVTGRSNMGTLRGQLDLLQAGLTSRTPSYPEAVCCSECPDRKLCFLARLAAMRWVNLPLNSSMALAASG